MHISTELNEILDNLYKEMIYSATLDWRFFQIQAGMIRDTNFHVLKYGSSLINDVYNNFDEIIKNSVFFDDARKERVLQLAQPIYDYLDSIKVLYELEK